MRGTVMLAIMLLVASLPAASAYHLSMGAQDSLLVQPEESPADPSVPAELYERGTSRACQGEGAFCGRLIYHLGTPFEQTSPPDQHVLAPGWSLDAVFTTYVGNYGLATCAPWCAPGGETAYRGLHDVGAALGLTADGEATWAGDGGWQELGVNLRLPHPGVAAQQATGAWEGNGWLVPSADQTIVALLTDPSGQAVDAAALEQAVEAAIAQEQLAATATPRVCAYTPGARIDGLQQPVGPGCEVPFTFGQEPRGGPSASQDGQDPCVSPAYVCGGLQPAWYAQIVCSAAATPCLEHPAWDSTRRHVVWHVVAAPSASACEGWVEPGFRTSHPDRWAYLAHDLEVFTPATSATGQPGPRAPAEPGAVTDQAGGLAGPAGELALKEHRVEPNAPGDTSQSHVQVERSTEACDQVRGDTESAATVDPWVDLVDSQVRREVVGNLTGAGLDLYATTDGHQDATNRPGPGLYYTTGRLAIVTDLDDQGTYPWPPLTDPWAVNATGAYPMLFDMAIGPDLEPDDEDGCRLGFVERGQVARMRDAGYGPRTGLLQVLDLHGPSMMIHHPTSQPTLVEAGTAAVLMSEALHQLRRAGDEGVLSAIDQALAQLPTEPEAVAFPAEAVGATSDLEAQCTEPGRFTSAWSFTHSCQAGCAGATVVTSFLFEVTREDGRLGSHELPAFAPDGRPYAFGPGNHTWIDVDPLDGDPDRNLEGSSAPPTQG